MPAAFDVPVAGDRPTEHGRRPRLAAAFALLLSATIAAMFFAQLIALATHRLDYPINDDWRYYLEDESGLYEMPSRLTISWLFAPAQDTLHVTGKALDWLVLRALAHDWSVLASLSFVFAMGGWLCFAARFVFAVTRDATAARLSGLALFIVPLAGNPYWVALSPFQWLEPAIAYHQMLPMLGLMAIAYALLRATSGARFPALRDGAVVMLTLFFGLSYSSGAFLLAALSVTVFALATGRLRQRGDDPTLRELRADSLLVVWGSALCLGLHVVLPMLAFQVNPVVTTRLFEPTLPWTSEFWRFFLGLFDRALLSTSIGPLSLLRGAVVFAAFVTPIVLLTRQLLAGKLFGHEAARAILLVGCLVAVGGYAAVVAYGRAGFGSPYVPWYPESAPELYARSRFFYWWLSAAVPLVAVAWALILTRALPPRAAGIALVALCALALAPKPQHAESRFDYLGQWRYADLYARDALVLSELIALDVEHARSGHPADPNREGLSRERQFREQRWFRRTGERPGPLVRSAERHGAEFVDRWDVHFR